MLEGEATARAIKLAGFVGVPLYVVHVMSIDAMAEVSGWNPDLAHVCVNNLGGPSTTLLSTLSSSNAASAMSRVFMLFDKLHVLSDQQTHGI